MAVPLTEEQKNHPLYKYYELPIEEVPEDKVKEIMELTFATPTEVNIKDINRMFDDGYLDCEYGLFTCPDGGVVMSNIMKFPGATPEMFDWWFAWHGLDSMRYIIWNKDDHYYCQTRNVEQALDDSLSYRERYWNTTHDIREALEKGGEPRQLSLTFVKPEDIGFDPEKVKDFNGTIICTPGPAVMIHFVRPTDYGCELRTRFYMGFMKTENGMAPIPDFPIIDFHGRTLLVHNIKEFTHLAKILPELFAQYKDDFSVGLK